MWQLSYSLKENICRLEPWCGSEEKLELLFKILSSFVIRLTNVKNPTKNKLRPLPPSLSRFGRSPKKWKRDPRVSFFVTPVLTSYRITPEVKLPIITLTIYIQSSVVITNERFSLFRLSTFHDETKIDRRRVYAFTTTLTTLMDFFPSRNKSIRHQLKMARELIPGKLHLNDWIASDIIFVVKQSETVFLKRHSCIRFIQTV